MPPRHIELQTVWTMKLKFDLTLALRLLGLIDLVGIVVFWRGYFYSLTDWSFIDSTQIIYTIILVLIIVGGFSLMFAKKLGILITYFLFPLRLIFLFMTFNFLVIFDNEFGTKLATSWTIIGLEVLRLGLTIVIHVRHFPRKSRVSVTPHNTVFK
jgi:hypothetical protein